MGTLYALRALWTSPRRGFKMAAIRRSGLRALPDGEVLQAALIVGDFSFVNRVANGLGVELSEDEVRGYKLTLILTPSARGGRA